MRKITISIRRITIFGLVFLFATAAYALPVASNQLIKGAGDYEGKVVTYQGEVIGDVMLRGDYAWINVNDGISAISIWLPAALVNEIVYTGRHEVTGDWVEVTGVFHRACLEHGGDLDIHARTLRKIAGGRPLKERLNPQEIKLVLVLTGALCLILILRRLRRT